MKFDEVPFVPCNDCTAYESCTQEAYEQGKIDIIKEIIQQLKDSDLVTFSQVIVFLGDKVEELEEQKE